MEQSSPRFQRVQRLNRQRQKIEEKWEESDGNFVEHAHPFYEASEPPELGYTAVADVQDKKNGEVHQPPPFKRRDSITLQQTNNGNNTIFGMNCTSPRWHKIADANRRRAKGKLEQTNKPSPKAATTGAPDMLHQEGHRGVSPIKVRQSPKSQDNRRIFFRDEEKSEKVTRSPKSGGSAISDEVDGGDKKLKDIWNRSNIINSSDFKGMAGDRNDNKFLFGKKVRGSGSLSPRLMKVRELNRERVAKREKFKP